MTGTAWAKASRDLTTGLVDPWWLWLGPEDVRLVTRRRGRYHEV